MELNYEGRCRRIDLNLRSAYPYLNTRIFKVGIYEFQIYVVNEVSNFDELEKKFDNEIRYVTTPVKLVRQLPKVYDKELDVILDKNIPSNFEGMPFTINQLYTHFASSHPEVEIVKIQENHYDRLIIVELDKNSPLNALQKVQLCADNLKSPYEFEVKKGDSPSSLIQIDNEVFNIAPSRSRKALSCKFLERDERLWFENINKIYNGDFKKNDLYFVEEDKTSCLVNFSMFKNTNLRNHLLLYDVIYCILPLVQNMRDFLNDQKISKDEFLELIKRERLKIVNIQPELRLDYGFINEAFQENNNAVISRRALSALCAADLVELNSSYIFSDPEIEPYTYPLLQKLSEITNSNINELSDYILWPKKALRGSLDVLNLSGPMGISNYGVNKPIMSSWPSHNKDIMDFEFTVHSSQIHLSHALNATYFPFFVDGEPYSDHPYALMMGKLLNFYKTANYQNLTTLFDIENVNNSLNPSLSLISTFDINDYIPIIEFEDEISSGVIRNGMNSLFSELNSLDEAIRNDRIAEYNKDVEKALKNKSISKHGLDLGEDALGVFLPFLATGKKLFAAGVNKAQKSSSTIQKISEFIENKTLQKDTKNRHISILSKVNRVARLKRNHSQQE